MSTIEKALDKLKSGSGSNSGNNSSNNSGNNRRGENGFSGAERNGGVSSSSIVLPWQEMAKQGMLTPDGGRSEIAEELRAIKRPLLKAAFANDNFDTIDAKRSNLIMVTSSVPGEGKSFTSINLAVSIAMELDRTALLVDADVARPSIARYLGFKAKAGLVDYLLDDSMALSDVLLKTDLPKLSVLPAGKQHHYSTELLASESMNVLLDELAARYHDRVIIFDSPPVLATSESQVLATQMGQVVMVVEAVKTPQTVLTEALSKISQANITGLVLNKSRVKKGGSHYEYGYYGKTDE